MRIIIPVLWIEEMETGKIKPLITVQNLPWKFIKREEFALHEWGQDYYYCEFELIKEEENGNK